MREFRLGSTRIVVGTGVLDQLGTLATAGLRAHRAAIVTDTNVGALYAERAATALAALEPVVVAFPAGEAHKTRQTWAHITDQLLEHGLARDSVIVALGGGVVGDLAGFVAATYLRGVPCIQVPTSLVAMIDASIGGKTGVDAPAGKNLVGAFHEPTLVATDPSLLASLPAREIRNGLAEALKHGAIADADYFEFVSRHARALAEARPTDAALLLELVERSVAIKCDIVASDPREAHRRKILNFGHTLGHAIETATSYSTSHGEAVAIGMALEARLGERLRATAPGTAKAIANALRAAGLPTWLDLDPAQVVALTHSDKKRSAGHIEYALPARLGVFEAWTTPVEDSAVLALLREMPDGSPLP